MEARTLDLPIVVYNNILKILILNVKELSLVKPKKMTCIHVQVHANDVGNLNLLINQYKNIKHNT